MKGKLENTESRQVASFGFESPAVKCPSGTPLSVPSTWLTREDQVRRCISDLNVRLTFTEDVKAAVVVF